MEGIQRELDNFSNFVSQSPRKTAAVVLSITACTYLLISSLTNNNHKKKGLKKIPSPKGAIPYFGHLFSIGKIPVLQFNKWHDELGPIISIKMGVQQWISVGEPHLAYQIFNGKNGKYTSSRPHTTFLSKYYASGSKGIVIGNPSTQWNKTRGAALQILGPKNREKFERLHIPEADALIDDLLAETAKNGSVNIAYPLHFMSMNVILSTCFGKRAESIDDPLFKEVYHIMDDTSKIMATEINSFLPIMTVLDILFRKEQKMRKFIDERRDPCFQRLLEEAIDNGVDCFATSLLEMEDVNEPSNVLVALCDTLLAGTDTSAVMLTWSLIILCHYPLIQKKIAAELDQFIRTHGRLPTFEDRESLPYSISVQKECMRFRPSTAFGISHEAEQDLEVNGYFIPKGATLIANMHVIHHNEDFYPDADKFVPDRYLDDLRPMYSSANSPAEGRDHFNFGFGRRVCIGTYLAELEIFNVWVRLFSRCVVEPVIGENGEPEYPDINTIAYAAAILPPSNPVVRMVKRENALI
ncbi:cytochrome P450 [Phascolomyces articulosus]|uniref:Cytochrome P450 n=1 Tax=Phascolomyces articulosus TaxID=60185 RepID=A0AAD5K437_9FUNG|nr:cytochrome P450 [Phascolomyces articulosus]